MIADQYATHTPIHLPTLFYPSYLSYLSYPSRLLFSALNKARTYAHNLNELQVRQVLKGSCVSCPVGHSFTPAKITVPCYM